MTLLYKDECRCLIEYTMPMIGKKIKVVHILHKFTYGGLEVVLVNMINSMKDQGFEHTIISLKDYSPEMCSRIDEEIEVYSINKRDGKDLRSYWALRKLLRQVNPNIVHTYNIGAIDYVISSLMMKGILRFHSEHGRDISDPTGANKKYQLIRRLLSPLLKKIIVVSNELADWLTKDVGIKSHKIVTIYNGVDINKFKQCNFDAKKLLKEKLFNTNDIIIGTVARLDPIKNHILLIEAYSRLIKRRPNIKAKLIIVGDGPCSEQLHNLILRYELEDNVIMPGSMINITEVMAALDIYVQSSIAEGVPMTILEAMSSSVPVISTDVGGISEVIDDKVEGLLVPSKDVDAMECAIESMLLDEQIRKEYGGNARMKIENVFSVAKMGENYKKLYMQENI